MRKLTLGTPNPTREYVERGRELKKKTFFRTRKTEAKMCKYEEVERVVDMNKALSYIESRMKPNHQ